MHLRRAGEIVARRVPAVAPALQAAYRSGERRRGALAQSWPALIRTRTDQITIAINTHCNLRCQGCRDFMPGSILYRPAHHQAACDALQLECPNCHCERDARAEKHGPSFAAHTARAAALAAR